MPTISVIVPVYKVEPYLHRCVDSILAQTFADFELILVDDGSPDRCGTICDEYAEKEPRVRVIHRENGGLSAARNAGIDTAVGEWLSFVDSDDYIHPRMLETLLNAVRTTGTKISSGGFLRTQGEALETEEISAAELWTPEDYYLKHCVNATVAWGKLYHRDCFRSIRYPLGKLHEDEFVTYRILFDEPRLAVIPASLYGYYQNPEGIMGKWSPKRLDALEALCEQMAFFVHREYTALAKLRMNGFLSCIEKHLYFIDLCSDEKVRQEGLRRCRRCTRRMLKLYRSRFRYSLLDHQQWYEFAYPAWIVKTICGGWKWLSKIKQRLKGR